jgi:hypothetical protein
MTLASYRHLVFDGDGVAVEGAVVLAKLEDVPRDLPRGGLHGGAAYALELVAELSEVHAVHHHVRLGPPLLGVIHDCCAGNNTLVLHKGFTVQRREPAETAQRKGGGSRARGAAKGAGRGGGGGAAGAGERGGHWRSMAWRARDEARGWSLRIRPRDATASRCAWVGSVCAVWKRTKLETGTAHIPVDCLRLGPTDPIQQTCRRWETKINVRTSTTQGGDCLGPPPRPPPLQLVRSASCWI